MLRLGLPISQSGQKVIHPPYNSHTHRVICTKCLWERERQGWDYQLYQHQLPQQNTPLKWGLRFHTELPRWGKLVTDEDPCFHFPSEKKMATHSGILAWRIPWAEKLGGYSPWSHKESATTKQHFPRRSNSTLSKLCSELKKVSWVSSPIPWKV